MPRSLSLGLLFLLLAIVGARAADAGAEDQKLAKFFKEFLDEEFRQQPLGATLAGDHRFDHLLDDLSRQARAKGKLRLEKARNELPKRVTRSALSRAGQIDYEILDRHLERSLWQSENLRPFEEDPRTYNSYISDSVYLLFVQSTLPKSTNVLNAVSRMRQIPGVVAAAQQNLENPPPVYVETAIKQNRGSIAFYERGLFELSGETTQLSEMKDAAKPVVAALKSYQTFLEKELMPRSKGNWRIGKERFARKLDLDLNAGLTADEVVREAEREAVRVENEMYVIARQLWHRAYPSKALPVDDPAGRRETITRVLHHFNQDHGKVENLVGDVRELVKGIKAFIREKDILRLPEPDRCQVIEMPEFQRGNTVAYLNPAPPLDPEAGSYYAISPPPKDWDTRRVSSFLEEYNRAMLKILTIHEAYPGHYVQLEYSNRDPSLIRKFLSTGVFEEGWAVYTEQMMLDQGYGDGDLPLRLNQLKFYMRAVVNALLDYRMHCENMTDEQALELLVKRAFQSEGEAIPKIVRAKQSSCQLSTYFVGRTAFYRLRQQIEREQGERFQLGRFHEAVLAHGSPPVKYLPELVRSRLSQPREWRDSDVHDVDSAKKGRGRRLEESLFGPDERDRVIGTDAWTKRLARIAIQTGGDVESDHLGRALID